VAERALRKRLGRVPVVHWVRVLLHEVVHGLLENLGNPKQLLCVDFHCLRQTF
jgi:hypothetical protein